MNKKQNPAEPEPNHEKPDALGDPDEYRELPEIFQKTHCGRRKKKKEICRPSFSGRQASFAFSAPCFFTYAELTSSCSAKTFQNPSLGRYIGGLFSPPAICRS